MTLVGAYGAYWFNIFAFFWTFYYDENSGSTYSDATEATYWFSAYTSLCVIDALVSILLIGGIEEYRDSVNLAEELAK